MDSVGNQYLHLVLPANKINFLNGIGTNEDSFFNAGASDDYDANNYFNSGNDSS